MCFVSMLYFIFVALNVIGHLETDLNQSNGKVVNKLQISRKNWIHFQFKTHFIHQSFEYYQFMKNNCVDLKRVLNGIGQGSFFYLCSTSVY